MRELVRGEQAAAAVTTGTRPQLVRALRAMRLQGPSGGSAGVWAPVVAQPLAAGPGPGPKEDGREQTRYLPRPRGARKARDCPLLGARIVSAP